ncbi:MAG: uncharacterized protein KVP18_002477 [Porospora cf. gigantea A]|uniref:uncharacterized protein n=1 Tax=Porospora cf. gigantea A TaxID=2853593 RepID=UPI00355941FF|nr:MAG: hypothetical protein KVP18_002477 [Porospora cf. gigantea A]
MTLPDGCPRLLAAQVQFLGFPDSHKWSQSTTASSLESLLRSPALRDLVLWLEETTIRLWKPKDRQRLKDKASWTSGFERYLRDLGVTLGPQAHISSFLDGEWRNPLHTALQTLVNMALEDVYLDALNSEEIAIQQSDTPSASEFSLTAPLNAWLDALSLPQVQAHCVSDVKSGLNAAIARSHPTQAELPSSLPPGVTLPLCEASLQQTVESVLRLHHQRQLQEIQEDINDTIAALQLVTANPQTDASLGVVGT